MATYSHAHSEQANRKRAKGQPSTTQSGSSHKAAPLRVLPIKLAVSSHTAIAEAASSDGDEVDGLPDLGMQNLGQVYYNLSVPALVEHALLRGEGTLASNGALRVETGKYTGRSPADRFIVKESATQDSIDWNRFNVPISEGQFNRLYRHVLSYVQGRDLYIFDGYAGADPAYRFNVRVINELASQNLFAHQLFLRAKFSDVSHGERIHLVPDITVIAVPGLHADPGDDGINSETFIVIHLSKKLILIGGSRYSGEIKKSVFTALNFWMPKRQVLPIRGAANRGDDDQTALFLGLSGTGKTTLSADISRHLIGDDEHGWSPTGLFNFEGGGYAKTIHLSQVHEPQIWDAIRFGALLENVVLEPTTGIPDYDDHHLTENARAAYPMDHIPNAVQSGQGNHPSMIFLLTADVFGVLPPIARLTVEQAMYHFLSGYTSKLAGTERGVTKPQVTFSACFGQCFFPMSPMVYAHMLGDRLNQHPETQVYWVNTGWSGGPYGVGQRISIQHTRRMVSAALNGELDQANYVPHPIFKVLVPDEVPGVPIEMLHPETAWGDVNAYNQQAQALARRFVQNFEQFEAMPAAIAAAAPDPAQFTGLAGDE